MASPPESRPLARLASADGELSRRLRGRSWSLPPAVEARLATARMRVALPLLAILAAYVIPLVILPPTLNLPLIDDWNYQLSVSHLVKQHEIWIAPWTAASIVLQIAWGALFAFPFGVHPTVLRCSTLVASFGGTLACYGLFRELGISRGRGLVGALAVWFNPITFGLSYTFMTDVPYLALMSLACYLLTRGVRRGRLGELTAASAVAGLAFLVRQQGVIIPFAALGWLLLARPSWFRARPYRTAAAVLLPCLIAVQEYYLWAITKGLPDTQSDYLNDYQQTGFWGTITLVIKIAVVGLFFVGLFVLPLVVGAATDLPAAWRRADRDAKLAVGTAVAAMALWTRWYYVQSGGRSFPFVPWGSMIHEDGLGVLDAEGLRRFFLTPWAWVAIGLGLGFAAAAAVLLIAAHARPRQSATAGRTGWLATPAGLIVALGIGQFIGIIPPSLHVREIITFDRYYLPLLPLVLGIVLWALRDQRFSPSLALAVLALLAVVSTLGLEDWFAFKQAQWDAAEWLVKDQGVPLRQVDGAVQWDGLHFYEYSLTAPYDRVQRQPSDVWWLFLIAPMIDPVYIVAASPYPPQGYSVYAERQYHSPLRSDADAWVYIWKRDSPFNILLPTKPRFPPFVAPKSTTSPQTTPPGSDSLPAPPSHAAPAQSVPLPGNQPEADPQHEPGRPR